MNLYLHKDKNARQATAIYLEIFLKTMAARVEHPPPPFMVQ